MRPRRQAGALKENLQRSLSVSLLYASWGAGWGFFHYHQPPFEHPLSLFVSMLLCCCQHNILIRCPLARKPQTKCLLIINLHSPDLQQHYRCILEVEGPQQSQWISPLYHPPHPPPPNLHMLSA